MPPSTLPEGHRAAATVRAVAPLLAVALAAASLPAAGEEAVEKPTIATLQPDNGHRLYIPDALAGQVHLVDGDSFRYLGVLPLGFLGLFSISPDGKELYVATTYYARQDHGARTEVLEIYDASSIQRIGEVEIPPKHAQSNAWAEYLRPAPAGPYLFVQNATPASSVTVVDRVQRKLLTEIPTAGCFGIFPSPKVVGRFSTLCGDGTAVTISFDAAGKETARQRSAALFDPENDPIFVQSADAGDKTYFISFDGNVHLIDFSGETATQEEPWSVLGKLPGAKGWRPGGHQPIAYSAATGQLFVGMHAKGVEGSHKDAADEIWQVDVHKHAVTARVPGDQSVALAVSAGDRPLLFGISQKTGGVTRYDASAKLRKVAASRPGVFADAAALRVE